MLGRNAVDPSVIAHRVYTNKPILKKEEPYVTARCKFYPHYVIEVYEMDQIYIVNG